MAVLLDSVHSYLNVAWFHAYQFCDGDEFVLNVVVPLIIMLVVYWTSGVFFTAVDMFEWPAWAVNYKIPEPNPTNYPRLTAAKLKRVVFTVIFNQTVIAVPVIYLCYLARRCRGYDDSFRLPTPLKFGFYIGIQIAMEEVFFYYSHRILHHPLFYKKYHKQHHEWVSPIGISAIYCHPVEHIFSNVLPTYAGSVIAGIHVTALWAWLVFATFYGVTVHSGYHLPLTPSPEFHNYHHSRFNENYGVAGILDWLHGTDKNFRQSKAYERNKVLLSLTPLK